MTTDTRPGPLAGFRIIDLTSVIMGPYATSLLADQGAEVIVVETGDGDSNRVMGRAAAPGLSDVSLNLMRNKRSVRLDLRTPDGRSAMRKLLAGADAFITTRRPDSLRRLSLDYETLAPTHPRLVYCQAQGWPTTSAKANDPAYDDIIQAATGLVDVMHRYTGEHLFVPSILVDKTCGVMLAQAATAALVHLSRHGEGQHVEVAMAEAMTQFLLVEHGSGGIAMPPGDRLGYERILSPERRPYATRDGLVHVMPYTPAQFATIFEELGASHLRGDPRLSDLRTTIANTGTLYRDLRPLIGERTSEWILDACRRLDIPASPVVTLAEIAATLPVAEHPKAGPYRVLPHPARFSATPAGRRGHAPSVGADTEDVLRERGAS